MSDYIKREDARTLLFDRLIETANNNTGYQCDSGVVYQDAAERLRLCWLNEVPAADVVERKRGNWIDTEPHLKDWQQRKNGMAYYCSVCGHRAGKNKHRTYKYCPWCGAKMDGDSDV